MRGCAKCSWCPVWSCVLSRSTESGSVDKVRDFLIRGSPDQFTAEWEGRPPARAALYGAQSIKKIAVSSDYLNRPRLL